MASDADIIIRRALEARTLADAVAVNKLIAAAAGGRYERPLGDVWNNFGLVSHAGDFDHKLIEAVTNAQDSILEREAAAKYGTATIPYTSPREAADDLLDITKKETARRIGLEIHSPGDEQLKGKRVTVGIQDDGCGMTPQQMVSTILKLGSGHKSDRLYQQGAFGLGVKSAFRNARAAIVVSRRAPEMGDSDPDRVSVAVVEWQEFGKGLGAHYLTAGPWTEGMMPGPSPWSAPADEVAFEYGTYLALIEYQVNGFHRRRSGDARMFQNVARTRLHEPVIPFRQISHIVSNPENRYVWGLKRFLDEEEPAESAGEDSMPFEVDGTVHQLPISWWVFRENDRDKRVAPGHVVSFTSSGQIHHHWDKNRARSATRLNKLADRLYVVVETDELPITVRTRLFTPDRAALLPNDQAARLEKSLAAFLNDHDDLREINGRLQREAIEKTSGSQKTRAVAQRISQAFLARGFATGGGDGAGRSSRTPSGRPKEMKLHKEPTEIKGPKTVTMRPGDTRSISFWLDARDKFIAGGQGEVLVTCDHPDLVGKTIPTSTLRKGRIRATILMTDDPAIGEYTLTATVPTWTSGSGGVAGPLKWEVTLKVSDEPPAPPKETNTSGGAKSAGGEVALRWDNSTLPPNVAGFVEMNEAAALADGDPEYADLKKLGEIEIPTIVLNERFAEFKKYIDARKRTKTEATVDNARGRYAAGFGVGLLVMDADEALKNLSDEQRAGAARAQARAALSMLPEFDLLMAEVVEET